MTPRRLWRDAPLPEGRIKLGEAALSAARLDVTTRVERAAEHAALVEATFQVERSAEHIALHSELTHAKTRIEQLEAALEESQHKLKASNEALNELHAGLDAERAGAREQGYAAGLERAEITARAELQKQLEAWRHSVEEMLHANDERLRALHAELTDIVLAAAIKLLGEQLVNPHAVRGCVEHVMRESGITTPSRVLIAPAQYEQLTKYGGAQLAWFRERRLDLAPDAKVAHGGCILETPNGLIDGRYEAQLAKLREIVVAHYRAGAP
jgi:flagellar assembly protein FliH